MKILLSIKPEYAFKIFEGSKRFEFRRSIFKQTGVKKVVVYASSPVKKVIGEFEIEKILLKDIESLWNETKAFSGITKDYFLEYFADKEEGYAIKNKKLRKVFSTSLLKRRFQFIASSILSVLKGRFLFDSISRNFELLII